VNCLRFFPLSPVFLAISRRNRPKVICSFSLSLLFLLGFPSQHLCLDASGLTLYNLFFFFPFSLSLFLFFFFSFPFVCLAQAYFEVMCEQYALARLSSMAESVELTKGAPASVPVCYRLCSLQCVRTLARRSGRDYHGNDDSGPQNSA
jgi:hypothetical protein